MIKPDYTHWHGTYEVARNFLTEIVRELEVLAHKWLVIGDADKVAATKKLEAKLEEVHNSVNLRWYIGKLDPEEAARHRKATEKFKAR